MVHFDFILAIFMIPVIITERISDVIWAQAAQAPAVRWSSCEMSHVEIFRVCMGKFTTALRIKKKHDQILNGNTSPYFHGASLAIWPLTMLKRTHFSELSISKFTTYKNG